jgi:hypothetical protein
LQTDHNVQNLEGRESGKSSNRLMSGILPTVNKITPFQKSKFMRDPETQTENREKCSNCDCDKLTLSREVCDKLNMLGENFPRREAGDVHKVGAEEVTQNLNLSQVRPVTTQAKTCDCPGRKPTPEPPSVDSLSVQLTDGNREQLEQLIKEHYRHSAFNVCPHQELPVMTGDPLRVLDRGRGSKDKTLCSKQASSSATPLEGYSEGVAGE